MSGFGLCRCETARLFNQAQTWFVLALGQGMLAVWFFVLVVRYLEQTQTLGGNGVTLEIVVRYFDAAFWSMLLFAPLLTMASIAGDRHSGMLRFLFTTPQSTRTLVAVKLCAILTVAFTYVAVVSVLPLTLLWGTRVDLGLYAANVLGLALFTLFSITLGVVASACTRTPLASATLALVASLALWFSDWAARVGSGEALRWSTLSRLRGFGQGLILGADVLYFTAGTIAFTVITIVIVDSLRRWS